MQRSERQGQAFTITATFGYTLDLFSNCLIIGRNLRQAMITNLSTLILITIISVLIIKDKFVVGMALVRIN
ncbi:MAG: hypothetical protein A2X25_02985 [Chloroflexi bacterium GWB2_49_20]|nr:MAG: hypothetical protein A2X25_02985 [Chloroflexi bacterium GWB2_49_20]OGN76063.1 MAG: hypothetical protein A2X26_11255 [Chloroflexi bacterium GWC2_49_37]OGN83449.1 MAG: hypothetical protein A2X27_09090 [Chloroflexi bacterium GWD2_49_16]HBG73847.1 hypothetical protein [Anaerolineae bacterium]HCC79574.1 hypothetical protein [Anaerolineae bacterium]